MTQAEHGYWICAAYQHLRGFASTSPNYDEYEATVLVGELVNVLNAVRTRNVVSTDELVRIGKAQGVGKKKLLTQLLPLLEQLKSPRIMVRRDSSQRIVGLEEHLLTAAHLYEIADALWAFLDPSLIERASVYVLQHTCVMPRAQSEELGLLVKEGLKDREAVSALGVTTSFRIVQPFEGPGLDEPMLFNEYVWRKDHSKLAHAIKTLDAQDKAAMESALSITSAAQGLPVERLSLQPDLLLNVRSLGLLDVVQVRAADGREKEFAFSPHLTTHPAATQLADDLLNDVRAVLACVGYGENYSRISRLGGSDRGKTVNFLEKLLRDGRAGDATAIGVDYQLLEQRGIITVEPTPTPPGGRYAMVLLRSEPITIALRVIKESVAGAGARPAFVHTRALDPGSLFAGPEETRAVTAPRLAQQPEPVKEARNHFLRKIRREVF